MAIVAGCGARIAGVPSSVLDQALGETLEDAALDADADRWALIVAPGRCLAGTLTHAVVAVVEEALATPEPVVVVHADPHGAPGTAAAAVADGGAASAVGLPALVGGEALGVLVLERASATPWDQPSLGFLRSLCDVLAAGLARRRAEAVARRAEDQFRRLLETSADGVCVLDPDGVIRFANGAFDRLVGARTAVAGRSIIDFLADPNGPQLAARLLHETTHLEVELRRPDGTVRWASCATSPLREDDVDRSLALVTFADVSVRRAAEAALRSSEARFRALVRSSSDVTLVTDEEGRVAYTSPAVVDVLGHEPEALRGTSPYSLVHPEDVERVEAQALELWAARTGSLVVRCRVRTADGGFVPMEAVLTNLVDDEAVAGMVVTARDISDQIAAEETLKFHATHDAVTGLPNRRVFNQHLADALRAGGVVTVLFADLDGFKGVNDGYGHALGDELLRIVGRRLQEVVRDGDIVVRHGGDEFAVLCPGLGEGAEAEAVAGRIVETVQLPIAVGDVRVRVGVSVGVATAAGEPPVSARRLLAAADAAMYEAKADGNGWRYASVLGGRAAPLAPLLGDAH